MKLFWILLLCAGTLSASSIESIRKLIEGGRTREALRDMQALQKQASLDPEIQVQLGELLQELAASRAERLEHLAPDSPEAHQLIGKSLEAHQKLSEALAEYQLAAAKAPDQPGIHFLIGNVCWKLGDRAAAKSALEAELALNLNHAPANLRLGQVLLATDATVPERAIPFLRRALIDPQTSLQAHRELGKALRIDKHYDEALRELKFVAERVPDDNMIHAQMAAVYRQMGDAASARREMEIHNRILQQEHINSSLVRRDEQSP